MTTVLTSRSERMPRADLRKKLDDTLADVFDSVQEKEIVTRGRSNDMWWYVHCSACKIEFPRPQITDTQSALTCPSCKAGKIKNGRYQREKDRIRDSDGDEVEATKPRPLSVKPGSRAPSASRKSERERSPRKTHIASSEQGACLHCSFKDD